MQLKLCDITIYFYCVPFQNAGCGTVHGGPSQGLPSCNHHQSHYSLLDPSCVPSSAAAAAAPPWSSFGSSSLGMGPVSQHISMTGWGSAPNGLTFIRRGTEKKLKCSIKGFLDTAVFLQVLHNPLSFAFVWGWYGFRTC